MIHLANLNGKELLRYAEPTTDLERELVRRMPEWLDAVVEAEKLEEERDDLEGKVDDLEGAVDDLKEKLEDLELERKELQDERDALQEELDELKGLA